ncbi:MAG: hypothetical protein KBD78_09410 [Oligoflexales bacterium]|nr:hypothetical protein [Oligoflexales bacterium]
MFILSARQRIPTLFVLIFYALLFFKVEVAQACSSCGSGGEDPLILNPSDIWRFYVGASQSNFDSNIGLDGRQVEIYGLQKRERYTLAIGRRLTAKSFFSIAIPYINNYGESSSMSGPGEPSLSYRYTLFQQNFLAPLLPQIQILAGYKPRTARSTYNAEDQREFLDAFGNGHRQVRAGIDVWSAMSALNYGFAYNYINSDRQKYFNESHKLGDEHQSNVTLGYTYNTFRVLTGLVRIYKKSKIVDGVEIDRSESLTHNTFVTGSYQTNPLTELRLTWVNAGKFFDNYNTSKSQTVTAALMRSL